MVLNITEREGRQTAEIADQLIRPMLPAAAASVKKSVGSVQNAGRYAFRPLAAMVKRTTQRNNGNGLVLTTVQSNTTAPR